MLETRGSEVAEAFLASRRPRLVAECVQGEVTVPPSFRSRIYVYMTMIGTLSYTCDAIIHDLVMTH